MFGLPLDLLFGIVPFALVAFGIDRCFARLRHHDHLIPGTPRSPRAH